MRKTSQPQQPNYRQSHQAPLNAVAQFTGSRNDVEEGEVSDHLDPFNPPTGPRLSRQNSQRAIPTLPTLNGRSKNPTKNQIASSKNQAASSQTSKSTRTNPQRPLTNGSRQVSNNTEAQSLSQQTVRGNNAPDRVPQQTPQQATQQAPQTSRELAQGFIRTWHANGYTFDQMTAADPNLDALFLKEMYDEIGIPVVTTNSALLAPKASIASTNSTAVSAFAATTTPSSQISAAQTRAGDTSKSQAPTTTVNTSSEGALNLPHRLQEKHNGTNAATIHQKPLPKSIAAPEQGTKRPPGLVETPASPLMGTPAPTRQDYIARLMAAKTKKPEPLPHNSRQVTPVAQDTSTSKSAPIQNSQDTVQSASRPDILSSNLTLPRKPPPPVVPNTHTPVIDASPSLDQAGKSAEEEAALAKRIAQTALLKEKMSALREKNKASKTPTANPSFANEQVSVNGAVNGRIATQSQAQVAPPTKLQAPDSQSQVPKKLPPTSPDSTARIRSPAVVPPASAHTALFSGRIPGLGLHLDESNVSSSTTATIPNSFVTHTGSVRTQASTPDITSQSRKRPAAVDAMTEPQPPTKRPFGPARGAIDSESMIIEVSEDEAESVESHVDRPDSKAILHSTHRQTVDQASAVSGPNDVLPPSATARPQLNRSESSNQEQLRKQHDLLEMKKRLAALQLRKRQAKVPASGSATPAAQVNQAVSSDAVTPHLGDKLDHVLATADEGATAEKSVMPAESTLLRSTQVLAGPDVSMDDSTQSPKPAEVLSDPRPEQTRTVVEPATSGLVRDPSKSLTNDTPAPQAGIVAEPVTSSVSNHLLDGRARRRLEIEAQRQAKEASFAKKTTELEAMRAQMQELENALRKEREENDRLIAELESLGMDTQGMNPDEMREMKDDLVADAAAKGVDLDTFKTKVDGAPPPLPQAPTGSSAASMSISSIDDSDSEPRAFEVAALSGPGQEVPFEEHSQSTSTPTQRIDRDGDIDMVSTEEEQLPRAVEQPSASDAEVPGATRHMPLPDVASDEVDVIEGQTQSDDVTMRKSSAESGEIASSSSSAPPSPTSGNDVQNRQMYSLDGHVSPREASPVPMEEDSDAGSEGYEPPDPISEHASPHKGSSQASTVSSALESDKDNPRSDMDQPQPLATQEDTPFSGFTDEDEHEDEDEDEEYDPEDSLPPVTPHHDSIEETRHSGNNGRSDTALETVTEDPPISAPESSAGPQNQAQIDATLRLHDDGFVPYRSAFSNFKSYGSVEPTSINPNRNTHDIDPYKTWCQFEAAGGVCNDPDCDDQHFRSIDT